MMDLDTFVADCIAARAEPDAHRAINELLTRACSQPRRLAEMLPPERAEIRRLHVSPELTVLKVVWAPGMSLRPHDHRMWASIGIYTGGEDNTFYRRDPSGLLESGGRELRVGDVLRLGDDTIHAVHNPTTQFAGAIHIYGGDFFETPRSEWDPETLIEQPYDVEATLAHFEAQNARFSRA